MQLEYIASAISHVFIGGKASRETPALINGVRDMIAHINSWYPNHKFGVLFNGYTESNLGEFHQTLFKGNTIQCDSGGLQMVTLGHTPNDNLRDEVYQVQAKYSTHGMCFDEIPLRFETKASASNITSRMYDPAMVEPCAKQTAKNVCRQIEVFQQEKSQCKPYLIIQGNSLQTYQKWLDICLKNIPQDLHSYIFGLASGGGCIGIGDLEDVERIFTLSHLQGPDHLLKNFHLLGLGSPNRIMTLAKLNHLFKDDVKISYDSTKHTGGIMRGQIQVGHRCLGINSRQRNDRYMMIWRLFDKFQREKLGLELPEELIHDSILLSTPNLYEKRGAREDNPTVGAEASLARFALLSFSVYHTMQVVDNVINEREFTSNKDKTLYKTLEIVVDEAGFKKWKQLYGKYFNSKPTPSAEKTQSNLDSFFQ